MRVNQYGLNIIITVDQCKERQITKDTYIRTYLITYFKLSGFVQYTVIDQ